MGHTIWVEIRGHELSAFADDCSILHHLIEPLDALAATLGVAKPSAFLDYAELNRAYADEFSEVEDDAEDAELTLEQKQAEGNWFDAAVGLASIHALRQRLTDHFEALEWTPDPSRKHWPADLLQELASCEKAISRAATEGRPFRFTIVP